MSSFRLGRRALLRGAGASIALPLLDAMVTDGGFLVGRARAATPVRLLTFFWGNGTRGSMWAPPQVGELSASNLSIMQRPFAPVAGKPDILPYTNIVTGLGNSDIWKSGHNAAMMAAGAGTADDHNNFGNWPTIATMDQVLAEKLGAQTKLPSMPIRIGGSGYGAGIPGWAGISWSSAGKMVTPYTDPKALLTLLFGSGDGSAASVNAAAQLAARRKSLLDAVKDDGQRLSARLGTADRAKVDEHLAALREVEKLVMGGGGASGASCGKPTQAELGTGTDAQMLKLIVLAFKCDLTRYASFQQDFGSGGRDYGDGVSGGDHHISHEGGDDQVIKRTQTKLGFVANLMRDMAAIPEAGKTLLDNAIIYANSDVKDGRAHDRNDMPVIVGGRAGGALQAGRHVRFSGRKLSDLFCSIINYAGMPLEKYGSNGTGPLAGF
jgi:hypothetical protein